MFDSVLEAVRAGVCGKGHSIMRPPENRNSDPRRRPTDQVLALEHLLNLFLIQIHYVGDICDPRALPCQSPQVTP